MRTRSLIGNMVLDGFPKQIRNKTFYFHTKKIIRFFLFTREYKKCTAGSTFCFVVVVLVVVVVRKPLIKLAGISADS
jgi:hypothetical protein